ncbi:zinc metalloprotease [Streptomyces sp. HNM0574]|uniref:zinc metalloprotease n=1 Tax=Streptomyces sp. HNM0574 TaxID=2714954 RepID=UPI001F0E8053|nr:zinc metalloprotease [Streptomyces sp. HNM0574]
MSGAAPSDTQNTHPPGRRCGAMQVHRRLLTEDAAYSVAREAIENRAFFYEYGRESTARTGVTHIPVVVHVVHETAAQNVGDAQIVSQLEVLNRDFRGTNPDVGNVPAQWSELAADTRVAFHLATRDPAGAPTSGITRTRSTGGFDTDDRVKFTASGGHDAWPSDRYLNMWVCPLRGGLLGYAQFPGGPPATDGVVITSTAFGVHGTATAPFDLGRTATHEVGHWLNLFHIWGDDGTGCSGSDFVGDTPNQAGPNTGTPAFPHMTCDNGGGGDMFMNFMDYTDDAAMFLFTKGQATRIDATLDGVRASFTTLAPETVPSPTPVITEAVGAGRTGIAAREDAFGGGRHLLFLHGRSQQGRDPRSLRQAWAAGLNHGLTRAGLTPVDPAQAWFPYYGDTLAQALEAAPARSFAEVAAEPAPSAAPASAPARALYEELIAEAAARSGMPPEEETAAQEGLRDSLGSALVGLLQRRLSWVAARTGVDDLVIARIFRDVAAYLADRRVRDAVLDEVLRTVPPGGELVLVSHSLGTVVAMDLITRLPPAVRVNLLVTAGSPLGMDSVHGRLLTGGPRLPEGVERWFNAWCPHDAVAIGCPLAAHWTGHPAEFVAPNSSDRAHDIEEYLAHPDVARAVGTRLAAHPTPA